MTQYFTQEFLNELESEMLAFDDESLAELARRPLGQPSRATPAVSGGR